MGKRPIIGISSNEKPVSPDLPIIHLNVSRNFGDGVKRAGGLPFYIPMSQDALAADYIQAIDKLIITGGQNVSPQFYGEDKTTDSQDYFPERDRWELALIKEAVKQEKPIFAVCRGLQLYNAAQGGTLYQDIPNHAGQPPTQLAHPIKIEAGSRLSGLLADGIVVNSVHHQALKKLAPNLKATAWSQDGIIEAIEPTDGTRFIGVQWHPEFLLDGPTSNQALFDYVVQDL